MNLAICRRIIGAHSDKITVESKSGIGTKFTIILPIKALKTDFPQLGMFIETKPDLPPFSQTNKNNIQKV